MMRIKPYYHTSADIVSFLRDQDSIAEILQFIFSEALVFSVQIEKNGNRIPYPVQYDINSYSYQIDYNFLLHCIALFVSQKTEKSSNYIKVVKHFGIFPTTLKGPIYNGNRYLIITILERIIRVVNNKNWDTKLKWFNVFMPKILEFNGNFVEYKAVGLIEKRIESFIPNFHKVLKEFSKYYAQDTVQQIVFSNKNVKSFWEKSKQKKFLYFPLDYDNLNGFDDFYEVFSRV